MMIADDCPALRHQTTTGYRDPRKPGSAFNSSTSIRGGQGKRATCHWAGLPELALFGAAPVNERVVTDGRIVTGAGVSAGLDLGIALTGMLRGKPYAQAMMLQAEYAPEPPFPGGTLATTPEVIRKPMQAMLVPFAAEVRKLA